MQMQSDAINNIKKSKDLAVHFLNISIDDLKAADVLHKNGCYPQAIFYLQQATEKLIKSYGYEFNLITDDKNNLYKAHVSNISHGPWLIYSKALEYCNILDAKLKREIISNSPVLEYLFKEFKLGRRNFNNLNKFLLNQRRIKEIKKKDLPDEIVVKTLKHHYLLKQDVLGLMDTIEFNNKDSLGSKIWKSLGVGLAILSAGYQQFYIFPIFSIDISIILFKHAEMSRYGIEVYPAIKLPNKIYTQDQILVKEFNEIYKIIDNIQKIYLKLIIQNIT